MKFIVCVPAVVGALFYAIISSFANGESSEPSCTTHNVNIPCLPAQALTSSCKPKICLSKPTSMTFVYTGGECKHSYHVQRNNHFFCVDHSDEGAPTEMGTESFIRVLDTTGNGETAYHEGWVSVGESFTLFNNGHDFDDSLVMTISDSDGNLLQEIIYQTTCDGNLFLCDRFGSVELCGLVNGDQGVIDSCPHAASS